MRKSVTYYIENLTADAWIFYILPYFLRGKVREGKVYYFNNSRLGLLLANLTLWSIKMRIEKINSSQADTRDKDGNLIWMGTVKDSMSIYANMRNNPQFQKALKSFPSAHSLHLFLSRWMLRSDLITTDVFLMLKLIFFIRIVQYQENLNEPLRDSKQDIIFFMHKRPWFVEIGKFAQSKGVNIVPTGNFCLSIKIFLLRFVNIHLLMKDICKKILYYWMVIQYKVKVKFSKQSKNFKKAGTIENQGYFLQRSQPRIAVEHYGHLNFDSPELLSDLFFLQKASLSQQDILIYFGLPKAPITDTEWSELRDRGISAVVTNPQATGTPKVRLFNHKRDKTIRCCFSDQAKNKNEILTHKWLEYYLFKYQYQYGYWVDFFTQHNIKVHTTWSKYEPDHFAILDALKNTGGVGVVYQRSFDYFLSPGTFTTADVVFGFSKGGAHLEKDKDSIIPYYVVTGYFGDHRFALLEKRATEVKNFLKSHGAQRILAYFDEHARNHAQWNLAYKVTLKNYCYLLKKVLENPWFGLILKPKVPSTLKTNRLWSISELLRQAEKTGRCFIFEDTNLQSTYPPAVASLGADVAVHGHLFASTAGVESALTGTPTLLLDDEGTPDNPLHILGEGRVVFKDIESMWRTCVEHWNRPGGIPGFADWSEILNELDPFRDGRAAERMGTYLKWLIEGFKAGLSRETVLADAAERYARIWGKDKILSVNVSLQTDFSKSQLIPIG